MVCNASTCLFIAPRLPELMIVSDRFTARLNCVKSVSMSDAALVFLSMFNGFAVCFFCWRFSYAVGGAMCRECFAYKNYVVLDKSQLLTIIMFNEMYVSQIRLQSPYRNRSHRHTNSILLFDYVDITFTPKFIPIQIATLIT